MKNQISERDAENMNDPTSWEHRKSQEIWLEVLADTKELSNEEWAKKRAEAVAKIEEVTKKYQEEQDRKSFAKMNIYHSLDIQKDTVGGGRVSIVKNPEAFYFDLDSLKMRLARDINFKSNTIKKITEDEIAIEYGNALDHNVSITYYVQINKDPTEVKLNQFGLVFWGFIK